MPLGRCRARAARVRRWRAWQRMGRSWDSPRARRRQPKGGRCCRRSSAVVRSSNGASDIRAPWFKARQNEATAARSRAPSWLLATSGTRTKHEEAVFFNAPLLFIYIKERTSSHFFASPEAPPLATGGALSMFNVRQTEATAVLRWQATDSTGTFPNPNNYWFQTVCSACCYAVRASCMSVLLSVLVRVFP